MTTFTSLVDQCELAISDAANTTWLRTTLCDWADEAMKAFPILNPRLQTILSAAPAHNFRLATDFRELITAEYPISQVPPVYLQRMNRLDSNFYADETHYDLDYAYATSNGYEIWTSALVPAGASIIIDYLANHVVDQADDGVASITINKEHEHIIVAYVVMKAYKERLSYFMQNPTAYSQIINQMVASVVRAEETYNYLLATAQARMATSRPTAHMTIDKFDRVY